MDRIDRRILHELQLEGRLPNSELAMRVGLTTTPCLRRVRHMEGIGVIRGYRALLDGKFLGCGFQTFVTVVMKHDDKPTMSDFEGRVAALPQVVEAHRLFGDPDYLLRVAVEDIPAYERFYAETLAALPGIAQLTSHLSMKVIKPDAGFPVQGR